MQLVVQSVLDAHIQVFEDHHAKTIVKEEKIWRGVLIYFWVGKLDETREDRKSAIQKFTKKLQTLKFLTSSEWKIELPLIEAGNQILVVSNFTLFGSYKNGTKIDFSQSGKYEFSKEVYEYFIQELQCSWFDVKSGIFGAEMYITSTNNGPINYLFQV